MLCSGIVLCGGRGTRVGGADKGLLDYQGKPLVEQVLARIAPQVDDILISANRNLSQYQSLGHTVLADSLDDFQGPLAGLLTCLPQCKHENVLIVPCDMPLLPDSLADRLLPALAHADVSYAWDGSRDQYLVAAWRRSLAAALKACLAEGQRAVHQWYAGLETERVDFSDCAASFANLNQL